MNKEDNDKSETVYLNDMGIVNALGSSKASVLANLLKGYSPGMGKIISPILKKSFFAGEVKADLPNIPSELSIFDCRNNQLALAAALQIETCILEAKTKYSPERIGLVIGTSTSGVAETELALEHLNKYSSLPHDYHYKKQEVGSVAIFLAKYFKIKGPVYAISTACSSSGKVFASARGLIDLGLCDAVIVGGADSICELTLNGFKSLEAVSDECCNPFSQNRKGINIGEGAAVFLMSKKPSKVSLAGVGESSDAHHMSAPEPSGQGARAAMLAALADAELDPSAIDYVNLHGTGTRLNDAMESHSTSSVVGTKTPCSSTKPLTGHTLGAAGATEAGICWLLLNADDPKLLAPHVFDGQCDPQLSQLNLVATSKASRNINTAMSNSFAFGGNNVSVILARNEHD